MNEHAPKLREPFPTNTIKVKPQSVHEDKGLVTFYVDSRLVAERLNEVVGAENWQDEYKVITTDPNAGLPVECRLTIEGVTKADVGQIAPGPIDDKAWKSAYSDAFKRAAVKFGVGAYLYESPNIWAEIKMGRNGKAQGFTDNGRSHALDAYAKWIGDSAPRSGANPDSSSASTLGGTGGQAAVTEPHSPASLAASTSFSSPGSLAWKYGPHAGVKISDTPLDYVIEYAESGTNGFMAGKCKAFLEESGASASDDSDGIPFFPTIDGLGN